MTPYDILHFDFKNCQHQRRVFHAAVVWDDTSWNYLCLSLQNPQFTILLSNSVIFSYHINRYNTVIERPVDNYSVDPLKVCKLLIGMRRNHT